MILPDIQIAVTADAGVIQFRLNEREGLTRSERGQRTDDELAFMKKGEDILLMSGILFCCAYSYIADLHADYPLMFQHDYIQS